MKLKLFALAALSALLFTACEKDMSEENGDLPGGTAAANAAAGSSLVNNTGCKDCSYIPMCSGSVYKYSDTGFGGTGTPTNYTLTYIKDTVMSGRNFKKFSAENSNNSYYNCASGVSTIASVNGTSAGGASVPFIQTTLLKANEPVGAVWTDLINNGGATGTYTSTIISKGGSKTVAGVTYADVIDVNVVGTINFPGVGVMQFMHSDYYYAKGIGMIKNLTYDDFSGTMALHRVLISAVIAN